MTDHVRKINKFRLLPKTQMSSSEKKKNKQTVEQQSPVLMRFGNYCKCK